MKITAIRDVVGDISIFEGEVKITKTDRRHFLGNLKEPAMMLANAHERYRLIRLLDEDQITQLMDNWPVFCDVPDTFLLKHISIGKRGTIIKSTLSKETLR